MDMIDNASLNSLVGRAGRAAALLLAGLLGAGIAAAQSLNWDGQTGVFITPLAWRGSCEKRGLCPWQSGTGTIEPGVNLKARHQFALGVSYGL